MIWGCIARNGKFVYTTLEGRLNSTDYIKILDEKFKPFIEEHFYGNRIIFQQDNAPCHKAKIVILNLNFILGKKLVE